MGRNRGVWRGGGGPLNKHNEVEMWSCWACHNITTNQYALVCRPSCNSWTLHKLELEYPGTQHQNSGGIAVRMGLKVLTACSSLGRWYLWYAIWGSLGQLSSFSAINLHVALKNEWVSLLKYFPWVYIYSCTKVEGLCFLNLKSVGEGPQSVILILYCNSFEVKACPLNDQSGHLWLWRSFPKPS